ncbi:hypothetical protein LMG31884_46950 (plasmid) [Xanthomonas hydrangeae]|nr:hypothetical protein LMG31884_46950 [Xanthomonas hydrangeae]CAD7740840.1 hypothetical protein LMG31884_46950 [Xanthomonas hydrangeae]
MPVALRRRGHSRGLSTPQQKPLVLASSRLPADNRRLSRAHCPAGASAASVGPGARQIQRGRAGGGLAIAGAGIGIGIAQESQGRAARCRRRAPGAHRSQAAPIALQAHRRPPPDLRARQIQRGREGGRVALVQARLVGRTGRALPAAPAIASVGLEREFQGWPTRCR